MIVYGGGLKRKIDRLENTQVLPNFWRVGIQILVRVETSPAGSL
jgi:hypothetical protein